MNRGTLSSLEIGPHWTRSPIFILILKCSSRPRLRLRSAEIRLWKPSKGRWLLDCAAATENILIAANALGLGACWVGIYPVEERIQALRDLLGIPGHVIPLCMVSIGYPAEEKGPSNRFRPERVHQGRW